MSKCVCQQNTHIIDQETEISSLNTKTTKLDYNMYRTHTVVIYDTCILSLDKYKHTETHSNLSWDAFQHQFRLSSDHCFGNFCFSHLWRGRSTVFCGTHAGGPSPVGPSGKPGHKTAWRCECTQREWLQPHLWHRRTRWPLGRRWGCGSWLQPQAPTACTPGSGWSSPMLEKQWSLVRRLSTNAEKSTWDRSWRKTS